MPQQVTFTDPKTAETYMWPVNPNPDAVTQPAQRQRNISRTSNTSNIGVVRQQGDDGPLIIHWEFNVYHRAHEEALWLWYERSRSQSIYLTDWDGDTYNGQIIALGRQQIGVLDGPFDAHTRLFYAKYTFEFEVWTFVGGLLAEAGVTP